MRCWLHRARRARRGRVPCPPAKSSRAPATMRTRDGSCHLPPEQELTHALLIVAKAAAPLEGLRVVERAKQQVPHGKIAIVEAVSPCAMVLTVHLGTLDEVAEPARRAHVPVIKQLAE